MALEPYGSWPRHQVGAWNVVMGEAKSRGWTLHKHSSHNTMYLFCPLGECKLGPIYSTAASTESVAQDYLKDVRRCPHEPEGQERGIAKVGEHLSWGEKCATAAELQLKARASAEEVRLLWEEAERHAEAAGEALRAERDADILNRLEVADWWAAQHQSEAGATLEGTGLAGQSDPRVIINEADEAADRADQALADISTKRSESTSLSERLGDLRERNQAVRAQLEDQTTDT